MIWDSLLRNRLGTKAIWFMSTLLTLRKTVLMGIPYQRCTFFEVVLLGWGLGVDPRDPYLKKGTQLEN